MDPDQVMRKVQCPASLRDAHEKSDTLIWRVYSMKLGAEGHATAVYFVWSGLRGIYSYRYVKGAQMLLGSHCCACGKQT